MKKDAKDNTMRTEAAHSKISIHLLRMTIHHPDQVALHPGHAQSTGVLNKHLST